MLRPWAFEGSGGVVIACTMASDMSAACVVKAGDPHLPTLKRHKGPTLCSFHLEQRDLEAVGAVLSWSLSQQSCLRLRKYRS